MVKSLGFVAYEEDRMPLLGNQGFPKAREFSEQTAREIDVAVRDIVKAAYDKSLGILNAQKSLLEAWARRLLEKETLAEAELGELKASLSRQPGPA
jgi:cell division protease FtsH